MEKYDFLLQNRFLILEPYCKFNFCIRTMQKNANCPPNEEKYCCNKCEIIDIFLSSHDINRHITQLWL